MVITDLEVPYLFSTKSLNMCSKFKIKFYNAIFFCCRVKLGILAHVVRCISLFSLERPCDCYAIWFILLRIYLSEDIHPNPGPNSEFSSSFLSFCNWNLNSLGKDDFYRISLLEAHNTKFNYDIISLCETSLNDTISVKENSLPGYNFVSLNNPDGSKNGGVGLFYKESIPLKIRHDLCFDECLVSEIAIGRKKIFFSVLYRNPAQKAASVEFVSFTEKFETLTNKIKSANPYAIFFTGDFNAHSQTWYPEGDTNAEGYLLD